MLELEEAASSVTTANGSPRNLSVPEELREAAQDLTGELAEWRLAEYLRRNQPRLGADRFVCRVSHANGRPILFLPNRETNPELPSGWQEIYADDERYQANFVKVALNVVTLPGSTENVLPDILRRWFGESAGQPGRSDAVAFERQGPAYNMRPASGEEEIAPGAVPWNLYNRDAGLEALGLKLKNTWERQSGIVERPRRLVFFVTLDKGQMAEEYRYQDRFLSPTEFRVAESEPHPPAKLSWSADPPSCRARSHSPSIRSA